jgi:predicted cobalt transporter CbtA
MVSIAEIREFHVVMVAFQIVAGLFCLATGIINWANGLVFYGLLGLVAVPIFFYLAYLHHRKLRTIER